MWLTRAGEHSALVHHHRFRNLYLPHLQSDEVRTRLRSRAHILWLWVVIDPITKIIPVLHLGSRTQDAAHRMVHELRQRLAPDCLPVFTTDGLNHYFYALTAHVGQWVATTGRRGQQWQVAAGLIYGQVKKTYRHRKVVRVSQVLRCGTRADLRAALVRLGLSGRVNTAFIERVNRTIRQSVAALVRRTWSTAQAAPNCWPTWNGGVGITTSSGRTRPSASHCLSHGNVVAGASRNATASGPQPWHLG